MIHGKRLCVIMPAYNAEKTLRQTVEEIPHDVVDDIILVDDASHDNTADLARSLDLHVIIHPKNRGYGGNQKTCYTEALRRGADIVVMLHPDYQYSPPLITALASVIASEVYPVAIASRILGTGAIRGGMPLYKYVANRFLTFFQNILLNYKLSEYHTGLRAFSKDVLQNLPLEENSDDFVFDNQMLAQAIYFGFDICEITCPTRYQRDASSIRLIPSIRYGLGVLMTSFLFRAARWQIMGSRIFSDKGRRLDVGTQA